MTEISPKRSASRVDAKGRAYAGSQRWVQALVNWEKGRLNEAILEVLPSLAAVQQEIEWVSPLEVDAYAEYYDRGFLDALGLARFYAELRAFWPPGGPHWDALAKVRLGHDVGVLLIEAKSYPGELYGCGCQASPLSRAQIEIALTKTKRWLGTSPDADWCGPLYQYANRLAHLYFLREVAHVPAWLAHVCFIGDPRTPTNRSAWDTAISSAEQELGLGKPFSYASAVLLNVRGPDE